MKLQSMGIVFVLICLPLILVLAYYISLQIDTIKLQKDYNQDLLGATYDAMFAFEMNTANEDLSSVSDSLRTIIEASNNVFMTTLATNLGMSNASKSMLEPYLPAILYTLYDGYYIYAPTYSPSVVTDSSGNAVSVGDLGVTITGSDTKGGEIYSYNEVDETTKKDLSNEAKLNSTVYTSNGQLDDRNKTDYGQLLYKAKDNTTSTDLATGTMKYTKCTTSLDPDVAEYKTKNILKTYIPYSARYVQNGMHDSEGNVFNADLNVIYTLDNYVTIDGIFSYPSKGTGKQIYYTKSGYLLPFVNTDTDDLPVRVLIGDHPYTDTFSYNENEVQQYIEAGNRVQVQIAKELGSSEYETIIDIVPGTNSAVIDNTNTNLSSDTAIVTRYENMMFTLEELQAKVNKNIIANDDPSIGTTIDDAIRIINDAEETAVATNNINEIVNILQQNINRRKYNMQLNSSAVYYAKAVIFSKWVKDNLSELDGSSIQDISGLNYTSYSEFMINEASQDKNNYLKNAWKTEGKIFNFSDGSNECGSADIRSDSTFGNHKLSIIRTSIQYNLNLAMSAYNRSALYNDDTGYAFNRDTDYAMPIMQDAEWERILSNISVVSFMQGLPCGLKQYNNYAIVTSTNNEIMTTTENVFYAEQSEFNDSTSEYHRYSCSKILNKVLEHDDDDDNYISFTSKEVKYDKMDTTSTVLPYTYDHKNVACYECINDGNYTKNHIFDVSDSDFNKYINLRKIYYIGTAKEKNDIYKMNAVKESEGYEILFTYDKTAGRPASALMQGGYGDSSILNLNKIKEIEIVFSAVNVTRLDEASLVFSTVYNGVNLKNDSDGNAKRYSIPTNTQNYYTWYVEVDPLFANGNTKFLLTNLHFDNQNEFSSFPMGDVGSEELKKSIREIKIIYK